MFSTLENFLCVHDDKMESKVANQTLTVQKREVFSIVKIMFRTRVRKAKLVNLQVLLIACTGMKSLFCHKYFSESDGKGKQSC